MVAAYSMLVLVLLVARLPIIERVAGHDQLVAWHRTLGPWPLYLVAGHGVLITLGYAQQAKAGPLRQFWTLLSTYPGVLAGTAAFALLIAAGVTSYRKARRRLAYETWWAVHLYTYLALFLAFSHQTATGAPFVGHPLARTAWTTLWLAGAALVVGYRLLVPLWRTLRHRPRIVAVEHDAPGVATVVVGGRRLDRLPVTGGQFVQWRVLRPGLWWQAHPYSLSGLPGPGGLRLTVKELGDHSRALAGLTPGTAPGHRGPVRRVHPPRAPGRRGAARRRGRRRRAAQRAAAGPARRRRRRGARARVEPRGAGAARRAAPRRRRARRAPARARRPARDASRSTPPRSPGACPTSPTATSTCAARRASCAP